MGEFIRDIGYGAKLYRKSPGFAVLTTSLVALGIAANTILFSVVDAIFLRPLPVSHPEQLVRFVGTTPGSPGSSQFTYPFYTMIRDRNEVFSGVLGQLETNVALRDGVQSERVRADFVTGNFFPQLGVQALLGRTLAPDDDSSTGALPSVLDTVARQPVPSRCPGPERQNGCDVRGRA